MSRLDVAGLATLARPWLARLSLPRDRLAFAVAVSVVLHLGLLAMSFAPPEPIRFKPVDPRLEVILLNARTDERPIAPDALAQVDMVGGGDRERGRARSPLPAESRAQDGEGLKLQRQRAAELEAQQRRLLALAASQSEPVKSARSATPQAAAQPDASEQTIETVIARLQAQVDRQISDYNRRPRRLTYGVTALGVSYARYVEDWANRIEKIGTERYPPEARGRLYDSLVITVEIDRDGHVIEVIIDRPSKHPALNRAVRQIVMAGAPYARFTPEMAREGDILQIVRTWSFTRSGLETEAAAPESPVPDQKGKTR
jgi:periplasmic protein TonB